MSPTIGFWSSPDWEMTSPVGILALTNQIIKRSACFQIEQQPFFEPCHFILAFYSKPVKSKSLLLHFLDYCYKIDISLIIGKIRSIDLFQLLKWGEMSFAYSMGTISAENDLVYQNVELPACLPDRSRNEVESNSREQMKR